jgi:cytochrome c553
MTRAAIRRAIRVVLVTVLALLLGGFLFAWSGIYNVAASRGHWAIVDWLLAFIMSNSVEARALFIEAPALDSEDMVLLGASHYRTGCAPCHGAPGTAAGAIEQSMLPPPPVLSAATWRWKDSELFWIVKHGIKYTGMPAWVAQSRDDEVWAIVSFLKLLPSLDIDRYASLTSSQHESGSLIARDVAIRCGGCHGGPDRAPRSALVPLLHGQSPQYLASALSAYARGERDSGIMQPVAVGLSSSDIRHFADYYAGLPPRPSMDRPPAVSADRLREGQRLAAGGEPQAGVPACEACHGENRLEVYPKLAGQSAAYLAGQLRLWRNGQRPLAGASAIMAPIAQRMTDEQIAAVSEFYAGESSRQAGR